MLHIRVINTKGLSRAVQIIRYSNNRRIIVKHIGSGKTDDDIAALCEVASEYIKDAEIQIPLFPAADSRKSILLLEQCEYLGFYYSFLYDILYQIQAQIGYVHTTEILLTDLVIMRIVEPASKLRSIELIETYFGISHRRQRYYESALQWLNLNYHLQSRWIYGLSRRLICIVEVKALLVALLFTILSFLIFHIPSYHILIYSYSIHKVAPCPKMIAPIRTLLQNWVTLKHFDRRLTLNRSHIS